MFEKEILELFKVMVVQDKIGGINTEHAAEGFVTDFVPSGPQLQLLRETFKPLDLKTFFTVEERENSDIFRLLQKQILHYVEIYALGMPGLFNLELGDGGKIASLVFVRGVSKEELNGMIRSLLYSNAPVKDAETLRKIVQEYSVDYDINNVAVNELRVALFNPEADKFLNGDDVVRYLCYKATGSPLLIKSPEVIAKVAVTEFDSGLFERHTNELAQVFNRHKKLIIAAKRTSNRTAINKIARRSKVAHVPLHEPISKRFVSLALNDGISNYAVLDKISVRDKFKYLNLLEYKKQQLSTDAFVIRNGKVHIQEGRPVYAFKQIENVIGGILDSLADDLSYLRSRDILLDPAVDYGLPVSRKQTLGNLPYGTAIRVDGKNISSGIYWQNDWGATDLDLSTIDVEGHRVGWGCYSGYDNLSKVIFSGDITYAPSGAMEFMTSSTTMDTPYGLFVNIFAGAEGTAFELVVGTKTDKQWIGDAVVREKSKLDSRCGIIGFVKGDKFVVYTGRVGGGRTSGSTKDKALVSRGTADFWTVKKLFDAIGIKYVENKEEGIDYEYDLSYKGFTYDKLERLLLQK